MSFHLLSKRCQNHNDGLVSQLPAPSEIDGNEGILVMRQVLHAGPSDPMTILEYEPLELLALDGQGLETSCGHAVAF